MNKVTMRGVNGEIRWSYHKAGQVSQWELFGSTLTATLVNADAYRLSQTPLTFVVPRSNGAWRWPIATIQVEGQSITATVGAEEA
jgi:hypothetical protein